MAEKNKRLVNNGDIIYPFTKQENVIGLQKTITDKLPIVSSVTPQEGFVNKQVWLDTGNNQNRGIQPVGGLIFATFNPNSELTFSNSSSNETLVFAESSQNEQTEDSEEEAEGEN